VNYKFRLRRGEARASMVMDHGRYGPQGARGGRDGGVNRVRVVHGASAYDPPHLSKDQDIALDAGDVIEVSTPGGGGFGDPFRRAPGLVAQDVARGYYTRAQATNWFGVALSEDGSVDVTSTARLRAGAA
jgi:N-methylhydantoinase B